MKPAHGRAISCSKLEALAVACAEHLDSESWLVENAKAAAHGGKHQRVRIVDRITNGGAR